MDKELSVLDQYAIIQQEMKPSAEKITIECKSSSKGLKCSTVIITIQVCDPGY